MRQCFFLLLVGAAALTARGADPSEAGWREALLVARTNLAAGIALCGKVIAAFPSNTQPLTVRARLLDRSRRYDEALKDLNAASKLEPKSAQLWQALGEVHFKLGHFKESVAGFDRVLELSPEQAPHHWQRGISLFYAGRYADGRKQFESHRTVNPNDVENTVWHFLCAARETSVTAARAAMLPVGKDGRVPMPQIDALFRGPGTVEQVLDAAKAATGDLRQPGALFYAHLYLGLYFDVTGDGAKAREHISKAADLPGSEHYMGDVARVHRRVLN